MALRFDPDIRCYIGERVAIPSDVFEDALQDLLRGGADEDEARRLLLDEDEWAEDGDGPVCPACGEALLPGMRFCNTRCAAAFADPHA